MENIMMALNAVFPLIFMMSIGILVKKMKMVDDKSIDHMNNLVFKVFMSTLLFLNVYNMRGREILTAENLKLLAYTIIVVIMAIFVFLGAFHKIIPDRKRRAVSVQGIYRSNLILFGMPLTMSIYGGDDLSAISILVAVVVPIFNAVAVILLNWASGIKTSVKKILIKVVSNPLVIGSFLGIVFWGFDIEIPNLILKPMISVSQVATPLAFVVLGASLKLNSMNKDRQALILVTVCRLIVFPAAAIFGAYVLGFRNQALVALLGVVASPTAVSSFTMAKAVETAPELAAEIIAVTSVSSIVTIFGWIVFLGNMNLI